MKLNLREVRLRCETQVVFMLAEERWRNLVEWAAGISTESAQEMQKGSCRLLVVSTR
jgi:hypothetical protein